MTYKPGQRIRSTEPFHALLCGKVICGVYSTEEEAVEAAKAIRHCAGRHVIRRCDVTIRL